MMKNFDAFYENELLPVVRVHEKNRLLRLFAFACLVSAALVLPVMLHYSYRPLTAQDWAIFALFPPLMAYMFFKNHRAGAGRFKNEVVRRVAAFAAPELEYAPDRGIDRRVLDSARLFPDYTRFHGEDYFHGTMGETAIEFCELHLKKITGSKREMVKTVFKGYYFVADFHKYFTGVTLVLPDVAEASLGWAGQVLQEWNPFRREKLVMLEDPDFEKYFVVYSTDQQEARYILSPWFMGKIVAFRRRSGRKLSLAFVNSRLHLAYPKDRNQFEAPIVASMLDPEMYPSLHDDICFFVRLVDELNLNLRIWNRAPSRASMGIGPLG